MFSYKNVWWIVINALNLQREMRSILRETNNNE